MTRGSGRRRTSTTSTRWRRGARARRGIRGGAPPRRVRGEGEQRGAPSCARSRPRGAERTSSAAASCSSRSVRHRARADRLQRRREDRRRDRLRHPGRPARDRRDPGRERRGDRTASRRARRPPGGGRSVAMRVNPGVDKAAEGRTRTSRPGTTRRSSASRATTSRERVARETVAAPRARWDRRARRVAAHIDRGLPRVRRASLFDVARAALGEGASLRFVDTGGGFGIDYGEGCAATPADFVRAARAEQSAPGWTISRSTSSPAGARRRARRASRARDPDEGRAATRAG